MKQKHKKKPAPKHGLSTSVVLPRDLAADIDSYGATYDDEPRSRSSTMRVLLREILAIKKAAKV